MMATAHRPPCVSAPFRSEQKHMTSTPRPARQSAIVIGGGIVGVTTAHALQSRGFQVTLVERNLDVATFASRANAGLISVGCSQPWNAPSVPLTVMKTLGRPDSPYLFRAAAFPAIIPWATRFLMRCRSASYEASSRASAELMAYSLARFQSLNSEVELAFDRQQNGVLKYFESRAAFDQEVSQTRRMAGGAYDFQVLDAAAMVELEPTLAPHRSRIAGGLYFPDDESGDAHAFAQALVARFQALGGIVRTGVTVTRMHRQGDRLTGLETSAGDLVADHYILCAGALAAQLGRQVKLALPVYPVKGYSVTVETDGDIPLPRVPFLDWGRKICVTRFGNRIRAAGTAEFCGIDTKLTPSRLDHLHRNLIELFPALESTGRVARWAGLRPVTPDGLPILGASSIGNLFLNVGHGPQGWGLSCGSAEIVADVVSGRPTDLSLEPFGFHRI